MDATYLKGKRNVLSHMYKADGTVLFETYFVLGEKVTKAEYQQAPNN